MAKWRLAQNGEKNDAQAASAGKGKAAAKPKKKRERKPGELSTFQKAVIIVFIVIFALSTLAGALASVFQSSNQSVEYNVDYVDSQYTDYVADLESQLEDDPENTETLLATARACSSWGSYVLMLAANDDEAAHGEELMQRAIGYYDRYLELDNASDARAERAMCEYYLGDTETATADLEALTTDDPEFATGWYDLGMLYEGQGRSDDALAAYGKAVELDPENEQGVGESAQSRIDALNGESDDGSGDASEDADAEGNDEGADAGTDDAASDDSSEAGE